MRSSIIIISCLLIIISPGGVFSQWFEIPPKIYNKTFYELRMKDKNIGLITGTNGIILKTVNGGSNWREIPSSTLSNLNDIFFIDSYIFICGDSGTVLKSNDEGETWLKILLPFNKKITSICLIDPSVGFITTDSLILKTTDGGSNWLIIDRSNIYFLKIRFINNEIGFAVGDSATYGIVRKTTNQGLSWFTQSKNYAGFLSDVQFIDSIGYIVGENELVLKTINNGLSWYEPKPVTPFSKYNFESLYFVNDSIGWVAGWNGVIMKTSDGGKNWILQRKLNEIGNFSYIGGITMLDSIKGFTVGSNKDSDWYAQILMTTNGGLTFIKEENAISISEFQLFQNYPNPFNPSTKIKFQIAIRQMADKMQTDISQYVTLKVFDLLGREVATLVNEPKQAGEYEVEFNADKYGLSSGVYMYRLVVSGVNPLNTGSFTSTKKFVYLR
ncbi:MAG: hypothetical protein FJ213_10780 [Ignavibacteria bacterium]|nr:hypothetical protein [Ignavibacteria bacterium]